MSLTRDEVRNQLTQRFNKINSDTPVYHKDLISQSCAAYEKKHHEAMPAGKLACLKNSINHMQAILLSRGFTEQQISSAVSDLTKTDNPLTMLFSLMSIVVPNFAYTEAIGLQPMPTKTSPILFPEIVANENRNGFTKGDKLLGSTNWNTKNTYSTNRQVIDITSKVGTSSPTVTFNAAESSIVPGTFVAKVYIKGQGTFYVKDDKKGVIPEVVGVTTGVGSVDYATGTAKFTLAANLTTNDTISVNYRYEIGEGVDPAQITIAWTDKSIKAEPYRLRSTYKLDDFYQAKQLLAGYDVDQVLATSLAGYINKEISGNVFDDLLVKTDANFSWSKAEPTGVAWALHRLSLFQKFVEAGNGIRQNIGRAGGNIAICGTDYMNIIETYGDDLWKPESNAAEPIGPYLAGTLGNRFKIIKNQDYPSAKAVMVYKRDELDASVMGGSYISLYSTPPLAMDTLDVVQGMGTQFGYEKAVDNSIAELTITE